MSEIKTQIGLDQSDVKDIVAILKKNKKIRSIILFGSRAKSTYSNGSDIDIALKGQNLHTNDVLSLSVELDELDLPYKIDLVIYDRIEETSLKEHIDRVGVVLFERK
ncbi:MAG: nucleotidyltransferase domain-containing protein [Bacteroidales bacterium]|nr:nucleotidyltransferase domain-containing protein [Bacteroidales bacterium]MCF8334847.1 nucleotidyltransferase domain-containing protein [Bacteroidales bacterium]